MRPILMAALAAALVSVVATAQAAQPLLPAGGNDQVPTRLSALPAPSGTFERAPVSFSWPLDPKAELSEPAPYEAESREFWQTVEASQLQQGIDVDLSAPGALIRLSPGRGARAMDATQLKMSHNGRAVGLQRSASDAQLQAAGMAVEPGTTMVRLAEGNGAGRYRLNAPDAHGRYVMHVFEPQSPIALNARTDRMHALAGGRIRLDAALHDNGRPLPGLGDALLVAPDGSSHPVPLRRQGRNGLIADVTLPADAGATPGLWELQVFTAGTGVQRDARTAFVVAAPTARLQGQFAANRARLRVALPIETASPGRFEVRGTLYATGPDRRLQPVSQAHSAAWFEPGNGVLTLAFDPAHVPVGYGAPFEVRQLQLQDQSRMAPIEIRDRAARF